VDKFGIPLPSPPHSSHPEDVFTEEQTEEQTGMEPEVASRYSLLPRLEQGQLPPSFLFLTLSPSDPLTSTPPRQSTSAPPQDVAEDQFVLPFLVPSSPPFTSVVPVTVSPLYIQLAPDTRSQGPESGH
jgi:hypothetical protein